MSLSVPACLCACLCPYLSVSLSLCGLCLYSPISHHPPRLSAHAPTFISAMCCALHFAPPPLPSPLPLHALLCAVVGQRGPTGRAAPLQRLPVETDLRFRLPRGTQSRFVTGSQGWSRQSVDMQTRANSQLVLAPSLSPLPQSLCLYVCVSVCLSLPTSLGLALHVCHSPCGVVNCACCRSG